MGHTSFQLDRRAFLKAGLLGAGAFAFGPGFLRQAFATGPVTTTPTGPYGGLGPYDANGIALPPGFTSREIAVGGQPVARTPYTWHQNTDGQATFPTLGTSGAPDGGWVLVSNSEAADTGGVSAIEFSPTGAVERAYRILVGTSRNCAGGPTPWGTWLSCEEHDAGLVWECDPAGTPADAVAHPALGVFRHEAACVDPVQRRVYLTEDQPDGCLYRFTPDAYPDLSTGLLEVAIGESCQLTWAAVPEPGGGAANPTRHQVAGAKRFSGGEGLWYDDGKVYVTTKGDGRVWLYDIATSSLEVLYDSATAGPDAPLGGVDNISVAPSGDLYVCEDGQDNEICLITPDLTVSRFLRLDPAVHATQGANETVGVVFSPDGTRMYFGAQRSFGRGAVYEVSGPFRQTPSDPASTWVGTAGECGAAAGEDGATEDGWDAGQAGVAGGGEAAEGAPVAPAGAAAPAGDARVGYERVAPGVRLGLPPRNRRGFLARGLPITLDLDEPAGIRVRLDAPDGAPIARAQPSVALSGRVALRLRPLPGAARRLRSPRRRHVAARLTLIVTDRAGNTRIVRRRLLIATR